MTDISSKHKIISHYLKENPESASVILMNADPEKISSLFCKIPSESLLMSLELLPTSILADSFSHVEDSVALPLINHLSANLVAGVFRKWVAALQDTRERVARLLKMLDVDHAKAIQTLLDYPTGTIGSLMNPVPLSVKAHMTAKEVLSLLQKKKNRYSRYIYVVDKDFCLQGVLPFKDIFYSDKNAVVSQLMTSHIFSFSPNIGAKEALTDSSWRNWDSIPVADVKKRLIGVIRYDALEKFTSGKETYDTKESELLRAGAAVGEIFQIGINATISAMGIDDRRGK